MFPYVRTLSAAALWLLTDMTVGKNVHYEPKQI